jgi:bifunctional DNase/RNase
MQQGEDEVMIDARPSDAIALALRWDCPIYVAKDVMGRTRQQVAEPGGAANSEELRQWLENLNEDETGGYKM